MAYESPQTTIAGLIASTNLSASQHRFVDVDANGEVAAVSGLGGKAIGVLQNDPDAQGKPATLYGVGSISKVEASAAVAAGASVAAAADGRSVTAGVGHIRLGIALEAAGGAGELHTVLLMPHGVA